MKKDKGNIFPPFLFLTFGPVGLFSPSACSLLSSSPSSCSWAGPAHAKLLPPRQPSTELQPLPPLLSLPSRARLSALPPTSQVTRGRGGTAATQPPPRSWRRGRVTPLPGFFKRKPRPSRLPLLPTPAPFSHLLEPRKPQQLPHRESAVRLHVAAVPEPPSTLIFPAVSFAVLPSLSPCCLFLVSWLLVAVLRAPVSFQPPAMATVASAASFGPILGLGEVLCFPSISRCPRFFEPWPVGLVPRAPVTTSPPAMAKPLRLHCSPPASLSLSSPL